MIDINHYKFMFLILCFVIKSSTRHLNGSQNLEPPTFFLLRLNEGDICRRGNGIEPDYKCVKVTDCADGIRNEENLDLCSLIEEHPIVCCPIATKKVTSLSLASTPPVKNVQNISISVKKCRQYSQLKFPKGDYDHDTTVDQITANPQEFPHMVIIGYGATTEDRKDFKCGGSLISESWVLTSGQCYEDHTGSQASWARLGELDIVSTSDVAKPRDYPIVEHVIHPDFEANGRYNDVALFRLDTDVEFSAFVRPICLNGDPSLDPSRTIATGWGSTASYLAMSDVLLKVPLQNHPVEKCNKTYSTRDLRFKHGILPDSMICASPLRDGKGACRGFMGGPLQTRNDGTNELTYTQFGISSYGLGKCGAAETPGVYTRVSKYIRWIEDIVWSNNTRNN